MPKKLISGFKGLAEHIDPAQLPVSFGTTCTNLNVDEPEGQLSIRKGYTSWIGTSFTSIISIYQYRIEEDSSAVITLVNDNGTIRFIKDGSLVTSSPADGSGNLTTPTGSAIDSTHFNHYFGWRNSIRFTTGVGSTNHVLWFGYTKRLTSDNDGLFGNVLNDTGTYRLLRSQIVPEGIFANVLSNILIGGFYYFSIQGTKFIEKRDSEFRLVDRFEPPGESRLASDFDDIYLATDGTYIYTAYGTQTVKRYTDSFLEDDSALFSSGTGNILGLCANSTHIFILKTDRIDKIISSTLLSASNTTSVTAGKSISCSDTAIYVGEESSSQPIISRRLVGSIGTTSHSTVVLAATNTDVFSVRYSSPYVFVTLLVSGTSYYSHLYRYNEADVTLDTDYDLSNSTHGVVLTSSDVYAINYNGWLINYTTNASVSNRIGGIRTVLQSSGSLGSGIYFYKFSCEDIDGQSFTLSDPAIVYNPSGYNIVIYIMVNQSNLPDFYRIKKINIYRDYSSSDELEGSGGYRFLKSIDISTGDWFDSSSYGFYSLAFIDDQLDTNMSSVTFLEISGIGENVKPRYVNGKYFTWSENQLHMANLYSDGDTFPSQIVRSPVNSPDSMSLFDVYNYREGYGEEIRGISNFYNRTVVFKQFSTGIFRNAVLEDNLNIGIPYEQAYVKYHNTIYIGSDKGVYKLENNIPVLISNPVRNSYIPVGINSSPVLFYVGYLDRLVVAQYGLDILIYNTNLNTWSKYTGWAMRDFLKDSNGDYVGATQTGLKTLWSGTDDGGTAITVTYKSGTINFDDFGIDNELYQVQSKLALAKTGLGTDSLIFYTHKTGGTGQTTAKTITLQNTSSSVYPIVSTNHITDLWGESFAFTLTSEATQFLFTGMSLKFHQLGETESVL